MNHGDPRIHPLVRHFRQLHGAMPRLYRAPGRVNLIGEHTDYNDGWVMPIALQFETRVAIAPRRDRRLSLRSLNVEGGIELELPQDFSSTPPPPRTGRWFDYPVGVVWALGRAGLPVPAADLLVEGDIPLGAGLSSSASLEVATAWSLLSLTDHAPDRMQVAELCRQAENEYVGTRCGLMDPFAATHGVAGHALLLDCRSRDWQPLQVGRTAIVICNSGVRHALAGGEYNRRREECEAGLQALAAQRRAAQRDREAPGSLREVTLTELAAAGPDMNPVLLRRCRHVLTENARVERMREVLQAGDLAAAGQLLAASHASLREDYAVSCRELDVLVDLAGELAATLPGIHGARMTGGGFGGCTVNLVDPEAVEDFCGRMIEGYRAATGRTAELHVGVAAAGAGPLS
ncbi:MAG: galactokinase [Gammaproteobacteria bacterium]